MTLTCFKIAVGVVVVECRMRTSRWTPYIVPDWADQTVYIVENDIDGEVAVPAADGSTDFSVLQNELKGQPTKIVLVAFDLLYLNGYDLRSLPLVKR